MRGRGRRRRLKVGVVAGNHIFGLTPRKGKNFAGPGRLFIWYYALKSKGLLHAYVRKKSLYVRRTIIAVMAGGQQT